MSAVLFILYGIINMIDTNAYILNFKITDIEASTRGSIIYSYLAGYFMFILKSLIALITLFILTLIIRVVVSAMINVFTKRSIQNGGGPSEISDAKADEVSNMVLDAFAVNARWILGFFLSPTFIAIFLIIIPLFMYFMLLVYTRFYNQEIIKTENLNEAPKILLTYHHYLMFFMSAIVFIAVLYAIWRWAEVTYKL
jgi:Na+-transporting methylmalonyl-CoA/oxaloacetate decarboxylase gamma subunit